MNIEKQVCSLSQAKKLKELGIEQSGYFSWVEASKVSYATCSDFIYQTSNLNDSIFSGEDCHKERNDNTYSAFTTSELGAMLADWIDRGDGAVESRIYSEHGNKVSCVFNPAFNADALIYCLENNLITAHDCNTRLNS